MIEALEQKDAHNWQLNDYTKIFKMELLKNEGDKMGNYTKKIRHGAFFGSRATAALLAVVMVIALALPFGRAFASNDGFVVSFKLEKNNVPFDNVSTTLQNNDELRMELTVAGESAERDAEFTVRIPKIFIEVIGSSLQLPPIVEGQPARIFTYTTTNPDPDDASYVLYTFKFSDDYKDYRFDKGGDTFYNASIIMNLEAVINSSTTEHDRPIVVDAENDTEIIFKFPENATDLNVSKAIVSIMRNVGGSWVNYKDPATDPSVLGNTYNYVQPGDIIMYGVYTANTGNIHGKVTITETLPAALRGFDAAYSVAADIYDAAKNVNGSFNSVYGGSYAYNKTNLEANTRTSAFRPKADDPSYSSATAEEPAAWTTLDSKVYTATVTKWADATSQGENPYLILFAEVLPFETVDGIEKPWTNADYNNVVTSVSTDPGGGNKTDNDQGVVTDPKQYDVALRKWPYEVRRNGYLVGSTQTTPTTSSKSVMGGDVITYGIRLYNQSTGDANVRFGEIVDYAPVGLTYNDVATKEANDAAGIGSVGWTLVPGPAVASPLANSVLEAGGGGAVTKYTFNSNVIVDVGFYTTIYISFTVKDLDDVIKSLDSSKDIVASGTTAGDVEEWRKELNLGSDDRYIIYHNAAEVSKAYSLDPGGTDTNPADYNTLIDDVDSTLDDLPFNDVLGDRANMEAHYSTKHLRWVIGKEVDDEIAKNGKATIPEDEDDYDFALLSFIPKLFQNGGYDVLDKSWDIRPLRYRTLYGTDTVHVANYLNFILKQLTPGNAGTANGNSSTNGDKTGVIYGTNNDTHKGMYYNGNATSTIQGSPFWAGVTKYYGGDGAALTSAVASSWKGAELSGGGPIINGVGTVMMYTVAINADGMTNMQDVVLTDTIPDGFRLVTDDAGNPNYPGIYKDQEGNSVVLGMPDLNGPGDREDYWENKIFNDKYTTQIDGLDYEQDVLRVVLGGIGHGSYDVSFLVVSDRILVGTETLNNTPRELTITSHMQKTQRTAPSSGTMALRQAFAGKTLSQKPMVLLR